MIRTTQECGFRTPFANAKCVRRRQGARILRPLLMVLCCPAATTLIRGVCFDSHSNAPIQGVEAAAERCQAKGGYLPTPLELYTAKGVLNLGTNVGPD